MLFSLHIFHYTCKIFCCIFKFSRWKPFFWHLQKSNSYNYSCSLCRGWYQFNVCGWTTYVLLISEGNRKTLSRWCEIFNYHYYCYYLCSYGFIFQFFFLQDDSTLVSALTSMMSECHCANVAKKSCWEKKKNKGALRLPITWDVHIQYVAFWNLYCASELLLSVWLDNHCFVFLALTVSMLARCLSLLSVI